MDVTANIVVNNGTATNTKLIGEAGSDLSTSLKGNNGYAYDTVSCTNSQTAPSAQGTGRLHLPLRHL